MSSTKIDARFFESTRGRIVTMLRESNRTVNEIAEALDLSDNAVRAHLLSLERDGLVKQGPLVKGFRKPHYSYMLTAEARHLFPKSYDSVLNRLLTVLKRRLTPAALRKTLSDVGQSLGLDSSANNTNVEGRVETALAALENLGGVAKAVRENGSVIIKSESCPFAEAVSEHPEVCKIAESMVEEIVGSEVREICDRTGSPKCRFQISVA